MNRSSYDVAKDQWSRQLSNNKNSIIIDPSEAAATMPQSREPQTHTHNTILTASVVKLHRIIYDTSIIK